jgi:murein DD-endopeptidase MepM/ murein hydrolase activator NlpD
MGTQKSTASAPRLGMPVQGKIIRGYQKKKNEGIDIAAAAGTTVTAAGDGTVAAITKDTDQVPILVIRHEGNLLTVYANIDGITVAKGEKVKRGQAIAKVRAGDSPFLHFEVRQGFDSVDPMPYLQ